MILAASPSLSDDLWVPTSCEGFSAGLREPVALGSVAGVVGMGQGKEPGIDELDDVAGVVAAEGCESSADKKAVAADRWAVSMRTSPSRCVMCDADILGFMRTTLEISPRVLAAARARVHEGRNRSIGEAVSELAETGLRTEPVQPPMADGLLLLPAVPGHIITNEMVAEALLDD